METFVYCLDANREITFGYLRAESYEAAMQMLRDRFANLTEVRVIRVDAVDFDAWTFR